MSGTGQHAVTAAILSAVVVLAVLAEARPAAAQRLGETPPAQLPPDARFGTNPLRLDVGDLNLPPGFGVGVAAAGVVDPGSATARAGSSGSAGFGVAAGTGAGAIGSGAFVFVPADPPPPTRLPPNARLAATAISGFGVDDLRLPPGFGVPVGGATQVTAALTFVPADPPPPARLPPNARLDVDSIRGFDVDNLNLPPGFGVPVGGSGEAVSAGSGAATLPAGTIAGLGEGAVAAGGVPVPATAATAPVRPGGALTFVAADPPPPARPPAGASFNVSGVSFGESGVSLGTDSNVTFRDSAIRGAGAGTSLPGLSVVEEDGGLRFTVGADVLFDFDKATLRPEAGPILRRLVEQVRAEVPRARYMVEGHTDAKGTDVYNLGLSNRRARSVKDWFVSQGAVSSREVLTMGLGENSPVAPNTHPDGSDDPEGRQRNRRVEVLVTPRP